MRGLSILHVVDWLLVILVAAVLVSRCRGRASVVEVRVRIGSSVLDRFEVPSGCSVVEGHPVNGPGYLNEFGWWSAGSGAVVVEWTTNRLSGIRPRRRRLRRAG